MIVLGLQMAHDGTAALIGDEGTVLAAIAEERLSRVKNHWGFPFRAISEALRVARLSPADIDVVAVASREPDATYITAPTMSRVVDGRIDFANAPLPARVRAAMIFSKLGRTVVPSRRQHHARAVNLRARLLARALTELDLGHASIVFVEHHLAHAASAYYMSGWDRCLTITLDAYGDSLCATASACTDGEIKRIGASADICSPGVFYTEITKYLGFRRHRHEGKITGLAAYGDPSVCAGKLKPCLQFDPSEPRWFARDLRTSPTQHARARLGELWRLVREGEPTGSNIDMLQRYFAVTLSGFSREDIAAGAQAVLEEFATSYVAHYLTKFPASSIALAGGTFANVKVNQRIRAIHGVDRVFIHPNMGDGGLSVGAALVVHADAARARMTRLPPRRLEDVYFGPAPTPEEIDVAVRDAGMPARRSERIEADIAEALFRGAIVGRVAGRMEYGPRALGNRSILVRAIDGSVNNWLNNRLRRTEFMPFAPSVMAEAAPRIFTDAQGLEFAAEFMTVTMNMTPEFIKRTPAVAHVDGTARPQFVTQATNPSFYRVLSEYERRSGLPLVINTSFNIHEEPIVCTARNAIKGLKDGAVDLLALGDWLIAKDAATLSALKDQASRP